MKKLRTIHVFILAVLLLELVAYFAYANAPDASGKSEPTVSVGHDHDHGHMHDHERHPRNGNIVPQLPRGNDGCIAHPNRTACINYTLPDSTVIADVDQLCDSMPHMPGCTINRICDKAGGHISHSVYCSHFSIYKDICTSDMGTMGPCANYTNMCDPVDSLVKECAIESLPLPTGSQLSQWITQMCKDMPMSDCKQCNLMRSARMPTRGLDCDVLLVYSNLCLSMPDMKQCGAWSQLCHLIPDWPICPSGDGDQEPIMRMYFHASLEDYVLFQQWVPRNWWEYMCTFFAIIALGIFYEGLKTVRSILEERWGAEAKTASMGNIQDEDDIHAGHNTGWKFEWVPFRWGVDLPRALFVFTEVGVGLLLMLVAMTFNVGLFLAVCCGAFFGSLIFGRLSAKFTKALCH